MLSNSDIQFGLITRLLHALVAVLIIASFALGWWLVELSYMDGAFYQVSLWHKSLGMLALFVGIAKVLLFVFSTKVQAAGKRTRWQALAAKVVHWLLLLMMIVIPITGYLVVTSAGENVSLFELFDVPALFASPDFVRNLAVQVHYWTAYAVVALVFVHIAGAVKHQLIDRDGTLRRMFW